MPLPSTDPGSVNLNEEGVAMGLGSEAERQYYEDHGAGILAAIDNLNCPEEDNLFKDSLHNTIAAILDEKEAEAAFNSAFPPDCTHEITDLSNSNPKSQQTTPLDQSQFEIEREDETPVIASVSVSPSSSNFIVKTELALGTDYPQQLTEIPNNALENNQSPELIVLDESPEEDEDEPDIPLSLSKEDLELSFRRSCKIVLTRCDIFDCDSDSEKFKVKDSNSSDPSFSQNYSDPQTIYNSNFPEFNSIYSHQKEETAEDFVESLFRIPGSISVSSNPSANSSIEAGEITVRRKHFHQSDSKKQAIVTKKTLVKTKRQEQFEQRRNYFMEQNKLIRLVPGGFECTICRKKFPQRWNLVVHVRIHTGEKPFRCTDCELEFRQLAHVQKHARKVHQREVCRADVEIRKDGVPVPVHKLGRPRHTVPPVRKSLLLSPPNEQSSEDHVESSSELIEQSSPKNNFISEIETRDSNDPPPPNIMTSYMQDLWDSQTPRTGCINLIHPDSDIPIEMEEDVLLHFLRPFLTSDASPVKENFNKEGQTDLSLVEIHSKLRNIFNTKEDSSGTTERRKPRVYNRKRILSHVSSIQDESVLKRKLSYRCKMCDAIYPNIAHLRVHMKKEHLCTPSSESVKSFSCKHCNATVNSKEDLREHIIESHSDIEGALSIIEGTSQDKKRDDQDDSALKRKLSYRCKKCDAVYPNIAHLRMHMKKEHPRPPSPESVKSFSCKHCNATVNSKEDLREHIIEMHPDIEEALPVVEGTSQDQKIDDLEDLDMDSKKYSTISPHSNKISSNSKMNSSAITLSSQTPLTSILEAKRKRSICAFKDVATGGDTETDEEESCNTVGLQKEEFKCGHCDKMFSTLFNLHRHENNSCRFLNPPKRIKRTPGSEKKTRKKFPKPQAQVNTTEETALPAPVTDIESTLAAEVQPVQEEVKGACSMETMDHSDANISTIISNEEETKAKPKRKARPILDIKCAICEASFTRRLDLNDHMKMFHKTKRDKAYTCPFCPERFNLLIRKWEHVENDHPTKEIHKCEQCGRKYISLNDLHKHQLIHNSTEKERPFKCDWMNCDKSFTRADVLRLHIKLHTGERPFKCDICGKKFTCRSYLNAHTAKKHPT